MEAERWKRLSPLLDALLEMDEAPRAQRLAELRREDPELASDLAGLLKLEEESEEFLSDPLVSLFSGLHTDAVIGPYRLERMLGEGGMGQVWLARRDDGLYQRRVALKLLRPGIADPNLRLRFTRERQILARLEHPHIARLLDAGISADGQPYLALEYVEGEPITDWCKAHELPLDARLQLFQQICRALSHAHANLIVHRDLKPSNILVTPLDEVRLLDFGIAKLLDGDNTVLDNTRTGVRTFTLHYAAPEQIRGEPVTTMTDVYSLGVVLYELLSDARPYRLKRHTDAEWEDAIVNSDPVRPSAVLQRAADAEEDHERSQMLRRRARMLAGDLDNIVLKALAKRPEQRYASVEAFAQDVQRYREGKPVLARAQSVGYRFSKFVSRHRWALGTAVLTAVVLSISLGIVAWQAQAALDQARRAQAMQDFVIGLIEESGGSSSNGQLDLRSLLDNGVLRVDRELAAQPAARAELYGVIAQLRVGMGDYQQALKLLERQREALTRISRPPSALLLSSSTDMGSLQLLLGNPEQCTSAMNERTDLAIREQRQLPRQAADFYGQLGRCMRAQGDRDAAQLLFQRALALRRSGADTNAVAGQVQAMMDLAGLSADAGDNSTAMQQYDDALRVLQANASGRHPLAIELERNLCGLQRSQGQSAQAELHCRKALELAMQLHGSEHRATIDARRQLASVLADQGRLSEAEAEFHSSRQWLLERLGPNHVDVARDDNNLGIIAWERGQTTEALMAFDRALAALKRSPQRANNANMQFNKALVLHEIGENSQALDLLQKARRSRVERLGSSHALVGVADWMIGEVQAAMGDNAAARQSLEAAVALTRAGYGPDHPYTQRAVMAQARLDARIGGDTAKDLDTLEKLERAPGDDTEAARLRWRAGAYAAEIICRTDPTDGAARLQILAGELASAQPEGGELVRAVSAIRTACPAPIAPAVEPAVIKATAPTATPSRPVGARD